MGRGGQVIDVRPVADFAAGHIPGAVSIPLRDQFATWLGWLVPDGVPLGFVLADGQDPAEVVWQALKIGYEDLAGQLDGGMAAWHAGAGPAEATGLVTAGRIGGRPVLDVRQAAEYASGHVPGAVHVELGDLPARAQHAPAGAVVMCGHGERAMTAASLLQRAGHHGLAVLAGGPQDWAAATGTAAAGGSVTRQGPRRPDRRRRAGRAAGAAGQPGPVPPAGGGELLRRRHGRPERTVTPLVGSEQFHLGALAVAAFVVVFGLTKAVTNAVGGAVTARFTRKAILVAGWVIGLPVPFMLA